MDEIVGKHSEIEAFEFRQGADQRAFAMRRDADGSDLAGFLGLPHYVPVFQNPAVKDRAIAGVYPVEVDMAELPGGVIDSLPNERGELAADGNKYGIATGLHQSRHWFPLAGVFIGVDHIDAVIQRLRYPAIATPLAFFVQRVTVLGAPLEGRVDVRTERQARDEKVGLAEPAVEHPPAPILSMGIGRDGRQDVRTNDPAAKVPAVPSMRNRRRDTLSFIVSLQPMIAHRS